MREFIYRIEDNESDESEVFIGWIRKEGHELIRCRECKFRYTDGENVTANYCLLNHNRVQADDWFCADAERDEE